MIYHTFRCFKTAIYFWKKFKDVYILGNFNDKEDIFTWDKGQITFGTLLNTGLHKFSALLYGKIFVGSFGFIGSFATVCMSMCF